MHGVAYLEKDNFCVELAPTAKSGEVGFKLSDGAAAQSQDLARYLIITSFPLRISSRLQICWIELIRSHFHLDLRVHKLKL